ncbi:MAG: phosphatidylglycerophosphatase A, partial [Thiobacillus sp.]
IVWDEIAAFALVLVFTPVGWLWTGIAFALFRLFDIVKPWPIRQFDARLKNGFGVMFDDLLAAGYTIAVIKGLTWLV